MFGKSRSTKSAANPPGNPKNFNDQTTDDDNVRKHKNGLRAITSFKSVSSNFESTTKAMGLSDNTNNGGIIKSLTSKQSFKFLQREGNKVTDESNLDQNGKSSMSRGTSKIINSGYNASIRTRTRPFLTEQKTPRSHYEINIRCLNLPNRDLMSLTDGFVNIFALLPHQNTNQKTTVRTETVWDNLCPSFVHSLDIPFQKLKPGDTHSDPMVTAVLNTTMEFRVYDRDSKLEDLSKQDFIGVAYASLDQMLTSTDGTLSIPLVDDMVDPDESSKKAEKLGSITLSPEFIPEYKVCHDVVFNVVFTNPIPTLKSGLSGDKAKHGIFYEVLKQEKDQGANWFPVYRSDTFSHNNTCFPPASIPLEKIRGAESEKRKIRLAFYFSSKSRSSLLFSLESSIDSLRRMYATAQSGVKKTDVDENGDPFYLIDPNFYEKKRLRQNFHIDSAEKDETLIDGVKIKISTFHLVFSDLHWE